MLVAHQFCQVGDREPAGGGEALPGEQLWEGGAGGGGHQAGGAVQWSGVQCRDPGVQCSDQGCSAGIRGCSVGIRGAVQ